MVSRLTAVTRHILVGSLLVLEHGVHSILLGVLTSNDDRTEIEQMKLP